MEDLLSHATVGTTMRRFISKENSQQLLDCIQKFLNPFIQICIMITAGHEKIYFPLFVLANFIQ